MKPLNQKGITVLAILIWVLIIGGLVLYAPKIYNYVIDQNVRRLVISNVESVESEIRTELISKHPIQIWNNIDILVKGLSIRNPVILEQQTENGWNQPGEVVVGFDGINTFRLDGIGRNGTPLRLDIVIQKS